MRFRSERILHLKRRSTRVTINNSLAAPGQGLHDADLAEIILGRLLERGTPFVPRGRSRRSRHRKEETLRAIAAGDAA